MKNSQKYEYVKLNREEYEMFWRGRSDKFFLNSCDMLELDGEVIYRGVKRGGVLVAAGGFREVKRRFFGRGYYGYRGPIGEMGDFNVAQCLFAGLRKELRGGVKLVVQPNVVELVRDADGNEITGVKRNDVIGKNLEKLGLKKMKYVEGVSGILWQYVLPTNGKKWEDLLGPMRKETKRLLVQSEGSGCEVSEMGFDEMGEFNRVMNETAASKGFVARDQKYYEKVYKKCAEKGEVEFVKVEVEPAKLLEKYERELEENKKLTGKHARDAVESLTGKIKRLGEMFPEYLGESGDARGRKVIVCVGMFAWNKDEVVFVYSGNVRKYMKLEGQYAMHRVMIEKALERGVSRYNFYGIPVNVKRGCEGYSVFDFKRGFAGQVEEMCGQYEMPLSWRYGVLQIVKKIVRR